MIPAIINCRDRVTPLRELVAWLERAGQERIILLDNASTYEPLLDFYESTPHTVVRLGNNLGARALWEARMAPDEWFVYTDPDVIPTETCPLDAIAHLRSLLDRYPGFNKAALGLYLDDVPADLPSLAWERGLVSSDKQLAPGVFATVSDTTFALYRPGAAFTYQSLRTGAPYQARHTSWYVREPGPEDCYYLDRAEGGRFASSWKEPE